MQNKRFFDTEFDQRVKETLYKDADRVSLSPMIWKNVQQNLSVKESFFTTMKKRWKVKSVVAACAIMLAGASLIGFSEPAQTWAKETINTLTEVIGYEIIKTDEGYTIQQIQLGKNDGTNTNVVEYVAKGEEEKNMVLVDFEESPTYASIEEAQKNTDMDFKAPTRLPEGYDVDSISTFNWEDIQKEILTIEYKSSEHNTTIFFKASNHLELFNHHDNVVDEVELNGYQVQVVEYPILKFGVGTETNQEPSVDTAYRLVWIDQDIAYEIDTLLAINESILSLDDLFQIAASVQ